MRHNWCNHTCILLALLCHSSIYSFSLSDKNDYPTYQIIADKNEALNSNNAQNKVFISFGGPTEGYHNLVNSICQQSVKLDFFTHIFGFTDIDLKSDLDFWNRQGDFIERNKRGYGYWLWKPFIINLVLEHLNENDILVYVDAGSTVNPNGKQRLNEYIDLLNNSDYGVLSYQFSRYPEICWTKKILLDYFNANDETKNSGQCVATMLIIKKNKHSVDIIKKWYEIASIYELIDDTKISNENIAFKDHRHDQSIYSLLVKKFGSIKVNDEIYDASSEDRAYIPFWGTQIKVSW